MNPFPLAQAIETALSTGLTYPAYRAMTDSLLAQNRTTGPDQSEAMLAYTRMNVQRMSRWDKTTVLSPEIRSAAAQAQPQTWLILTEPWCGDAAQNIPVIQQVADASGDNITVVLALRDENPALMDLFLTDGGRSIPKLIALDTAHNVLWTWGPRPAVLQAMVAANKTLPEDERKTKEQLAEVIHGWYAKNKGVELQQELVELM